LIAQSMRTSYLSQVAPESLSLFPYWMTSLDVSFDWADRMVSALEGLSLRGVCDHSVSSAPFSTHRAIIK
jgi:hypothetical protein